MPIKLRKCKACGKKGIKFASDGCKYCGASWNYVPKKNSLNIDFSSLDTILYYSLMLLLVLIFWVLISLNFGAAIFYVLIVGAIYLAIKTEGFSK